MYAELKRKVCATCKIVKEEKDFHADRGSKDGRASRCRVCRNKAFKVWASNNVEKRQIKEFKRGLRRSYGINVEQYNQMFIEQKGCCKICLTHQSLLTRRLAVDHCHDSKVIRGLLCDRCNPMLGYARDNIEVLDAAIKYLNKFKK